MSQAPITPVQYPFHDSPAPAQGAEIIPGLFWLRLPLPFGVDHINVWLFREEGGWTLIDTGLDTKDSRAAWQTLFRTLLDGLPIHRIIVTHLHPDHIGLANHLAENSGSEVFMTAETERHGRRLWQGIDAETRTGLRDFCRIHGIERDNDYIAFITGTGYRRMTAGIPDQVTIINDGTTLRIGDHEWTPIIANGHAPGHMSLYCGEQGLLVSGDQILPSITCNVSVFATNRDEDALDAYLESLQRFAALPDDTLVLPSHGRVFRGLHERIDTIREHHRENLDRLLSICEQPRCLGEAAPKLYRRSLEGSDYTLAMGETLAHLVYLYNHGELSMYTEGGRYSFVRK